jgi:monoamine oxidase
MQSTKETRELTDRVGQLERIIVVGAGLAGVAAARALHDRGYQVVILEGRDRVGGRCFTVDGIDFGAHWIHGTEGNPITNLARRLGVATYFVGGDSTYLGGWESIVLFGPSRERLSDDRKLRSILLADRVKDELDDLRTRMTQERKPDLSFHEAIRAVSSNKTLDLFDLRSLDWHFTGATRDEWGASADQVSFLNGDTNYEVFGYGDSVLECGYQPLVERYAKGLDIRLNEIVTRIEHTDSLNVVVKTQRSRFIVDRVIVTVPLGVLKTGRIEFEPQLPARKLAAIERLGWGNLAKVFLRFNRPFWPTEEYAFGYMCRELEMYPTDIINLYKSHGVPVLAMLIGGQNGRYLESWSEERATQWAMSVVRDVFGQDVPDPVAIVRTRWGQDPLAQGAYSYLPVGATTSDIDALAEPLGTRLFFAGEATQRQHWGCAHGALVSGLREAARICGDSSILPSRHFTENRRWREMTHRANRFLNYRGKMLTTEELKERGRLLRSCQIFSTIPDSEREALATMFSEAKYNDGDIICRAGEKGDQMFVIREGEVEILISENPKRGVRMQAGGVFGEYGLFMSGRRTATVVARGALRVLVLDYYRFRSFLLTFPEAALALLTITVQRLSEIQSGT